MSDVFRDDGSMRTPLSLLSVREGKCPRREQEGEGMEYQTWYPTTGFLCSDCILTTLQYMRLGDPRDLLFVRATKSVIAWPEKIEGYAGVGRVFKPINEDDEEPPDDLPTWQVRHES